MSNKSKMEGNYRHKPLDTTYSGYDLLCEKCGKIKLTLAEFRAQLSDRPEQVWFCPQCSSIAQFQG